MLCIDSCTIQNQHARMYRWENEAVPGNSLQVCTYLDRAAGGEMPKAATIFLLRPYVVKCRCNVSMLQESGAESVVFAWTSHATDSKGLFPSSLGQSPQIRLPKVPM